MSKYHELVDEYKDWIGWIEEQQAELGEMEDVADSEGMFCDFDPDTEYTYDIQDMADLNNELQRNRQELAAVIEYEYETVPYDKPRNAGIAGFWREAGLRKPA